MKDGQIAEHGTHAQLMAKERDYASLFTSVQQEVRPGANEASDQLLVNKSSVTPGTITLYITR